MFECREAVEEGEGFCVDKVEGGTAESEGGVHDDAVYRTDIALFCGEVLEGFEDRDVDLVEGSFGDDRFGFHWTAWQFEVFVDDVSFILPVSDDGSDVVVHVVGYSSADEWEGFGVDLDL